MPARAASAAHPDATIGFRQHVESAAARLSRLAALT